MPPRESTTGPRHYIHSFTATVLSYGRVESFDVDERQRIDNGHAGEIFVAKHTYFYEAVHEEAAPRNELQGYSTARNSYVGATADGVGAIATGDAMRGVKLAQHAILNEKGRSDR